MGNVLTEEEKIKKEFKKEFKNDKFPFENIAFEGGGCKGAAHLGAVRVLEWIGVWKNMKRFAGTSAGSIIAMCGALGMDLHEMEDLMKKLSKGFGSVMKVSCVNCICFLPNMIWNYGWKSGKNMEKLIGKLYKKMGRELCVIVTNVDQQDSQYCHVKTTPNMSIKQAVRMSISIPGILMPVVDSNKQHYVDGCLTHNYPVRVFDGWYLSMEPKDSLLLKMANLDDVASATNPNYQFGHEPNKKTIGVLLYSAEEKKMYKDEFEKRATQGTPGEIPLPETKLARTHRRKLGKAQEARKKHEELAGAYKAFVDVLSQQFTCFNDCKESIPAKQLKTALDKAQADGKFTDAQRALLFQGSKTNDDVIKSLDKDNDRQISITDLTKYAESQGREFRSIFRGYETREIKHLHQYFISVLSTTHLTCTRHHFERFDQYRSIGIDTGYIGTLDAKMEQGDMEYLLQQGQQGCLAFLRFYKKQQQETRGTESPDWNDVTN